MNFFLDNNLPPRLARALNILSEPDGHSVVPFIDKCSDDNIKDVDWINELSKESDWVIITNDKQISKNAYERKAWLESGLTIFFLEKGWGNLHFWIVAWKLIKWWPDIINQAIKIKSNVGYRIPVTGKKMTIMDLSR